MSVQKIQSTFDSLTKYPDRGSIVVFEYEKEVVGYALLINFWSNEFGGNILNIDELYIKKEWRSQGVGTGFIKYLMSSKPAGAIALQLEVTPGNHKARKLYTKLGFKPRKNDTLTFELE